METTPPPSSPTKAQVLTADNLRNAFSPVMVGLDWGTNLSRLLAAPFGSDRVVLDALVPTLVGYAREDIIPGVLPDDAIALFGDAAVQNKLHLNLVRPLEAGVICDPRAAHLFARHLKALLGNPKGEVRAVIGLPATADLQAREYARAALQGVFNKVLFVPEPFLAALGFRQDARLRDRDYEDPVRNSLFIDIGAGSTDLCLVQGHYPTAEDQLSSPLAGDAIDALIHEKILKTYPDCGLSLSRVRAIKEEHSWVWSDAAAAPAIATILVGGKSRQIDVTTQVGEGCAALLEQVVGMVAELVARADPESVAELLRNIIVTGGGSLIKGLGVALQTRLIEEGFENPRVQVLGEHYKDFVAQGALKTATRAREDQWQTLLG